MRSQLLMRGVVRCFDFDIGYADPGALSPALTNPTTARHYLWLHGATWTESDHYAMRPDGHLAPLRNQ